MNVISNVVIRRFRNTGIILDVFDTTVVRNSFMTGINGNSMSLLGEISAVKMINNTLIRNRDPHSESSSSLILAFVKYHTSFYAYENFFFDNGHLKVFKFTIPSAVARSIIEITNNSVVNNTCENVVEVEHERSCLLSSVQKVVLANNIWRNNQVRSSSVKLRRFNRCYSSKKCNILITKNEFSNNTCISIVDVELERSTNVIVITVSFGGYFITI